jgi:hypothetical protein
MGLFGVDLRSFWFLFGNLFSTVTLHLNPHGFFKAYLDVGMGHSCSRYMVVSITSMRTARVYSAAFAYSFFSLFDLIPI